MCGEADRAAELAAREWRIDLRPAESGDVAGDRGQLRVQRVARAIGEVRVAMARDRTQQHGDAGRKARVAARCPLERRERVDVCKVELPREKLLERALRRGRQCGRAVVAENGDTEGAGVEAERVRTDDCLVDAAVA